jgi:biotin-(acetyl-CoA carboxylase) ligase
MNVFNTPWQHDPSLADNSARLADLLTVVPDLDSLAAATLDSLEAARRAMLEGGLSEAVRELNAHWETARPVEITLIAGRRISGKFKGLDQVANLRILTPSGDEVLVAHHP